jgi:hypothetical protein
MFNVKPVFAATALFLAGIGLVPTAQAAKPTPSLNVVLREYTRTFELAPGETAFVASACLLGETVLGGSTTGWSANLTQTMSHLFFDGTRSGWAVEYRNEGTETVHASATTGAICAPGTMTVGQSG